MLASIPKFVAAVFVLLVVHVSAGPVTLYELSGTPGSSTIIGDESITISAAGVGADGWTTYIEEEFITSEVLEAPSTTRTLVTAPITLFVTFEENASGARAVLPATDIGVTLVQSCGYGNDGRATCVAHEDIRSTEVDFQTVTGSVVPFYTIISSPSAAFSIRISVGRSETMAFVVTLGIGALIHAL
ncbi:hypothetical protein K438DRAFT_1964286 [Mycena galopus ATCC 62051]|nr:hypothetical protein K438DRAFT_1964286 [Mycena galopus ATCC 62051]